MTLSKTLGALGAAALLSVSLTACGGGSGSDASSAPTNADKAAFCKLWTGMNDAIDEKASSSDQAGQAHDLADKMSELGTPSGTSDDARKGFELFVKWLGGVSSSDVEKLNASNEDNMPFTGTEKSEFQTFSKELLVPCLMGSAASDMATAIPSN